MDRYTAQGKNFAKRPERPARPARQAQSSAQTLRLTGSTGSITAGRESDRQRLSSIRTDRQAGAISAQRSAKKSLKAAGARQTPRERNDGPSSSQIRLKNFIVTLPMAVSWLLEPSVRCEMLLRKEVSLPPRRNVAPTRPGMAAERVTTAPSATRAEQIVSTARPLRKMVCTRWAT